MENSEKKLERWLLGIPCETSFWSNVFLCKSDREWCVKNAKSEIHLHNFDVQSFLRKLESQDEGCIVIDLGCGLSYMAGSMMDGKRLNIHFIDPLANFYNDIIKKSKLDLPKIEFGMMEYISSFYGENKVALIIIQNALDHSEDPIKGIVESIISLEIGGILYLKHYPNEAEKEAYRGFHQYNIDIEDNQLVIWNRNMKYNLNKLLEGFTEITTSRYSTPNEVICLIKKTKDVPSVYRNSQDDIKTLSCRLINQAKLTDNLSFVLQYQTKKLLYFITRRMMNIVTSSTKEHIRNIVRKKRMK